MLKNAVGFQALVSVMMLRSASNPNFGSGRGSQRTTVSATVMHRDEVGIEGVVNNSDRNVAVLLSDIRDELRRHNQRADNQTIETAARNIV
jgi:hypothetical protein